MDEKKKKFQSIFSRDRPRAIYRESDEYKTEEPIQKISFAEQIETNNLQGLQEKLSTLTQEWKPNITLVTAQFQSANSPLAKTKTQQLNGLTSQENSPTYSKKEQTAINIQDQNQYLKPSLIPNISTESNLDHQGTQGTHQAIVNQLKMAQNNIQVVPQKSQFAQAQYVPFQIESKVEQRELQVIQKPEIQQKQDLENQYRYKQQQTQQTQASQQLEQRQAQQQFIQQQQQKQQSVSKSKVFNINGVKYIGLRPLGSGGSATVYQTMTPDLQQFALKVINLKDENDELCGKKAIMSEIQILEKLKGKNITLDIDQYQFTDTQAFIVMQLGDIDLRTFLKQNTILSKAKILSMIEDMCETTMLMHQSGFIHGDLKPHNYMFYHAKLVLIDFGISKEMQQQQTTVIRDSLSGTPKYMAPEVIKSQYGIKGAKIHRASDVWSIGCILYEMICGKSPFDLLLKQTKNPLVFIQRIRDGDFEIDFNCISDLQLKNMAVQMLAIDDNARISLELILKQLRGKI